MSWEPLSKFTGAASSVRNGLKRGRLAHAFLVFGDDLDTMESFARTLAMTVNCQQPPETGAGGIGCDCCGRCGPCQKIQRGIHPDIVWIRPESKSRQIRTEQMSDLLQTAHLKPNEARYKVFILSGADRLNLQAANKFLKTLEEPPSDSLMLLLSTAPEQVLETLRSRCQRLQLGAGKALPLSPEDQAWLTTFAEAASREQGSLLERYRLLSLLLKRLTGLKESIEERLLAESPLEGDSDLDPNYRARLEAELAASVEAEYRRQRAGILGALHRWLRDVWLTSLGSGDGLQEFPSLASSTNAVARRIAATEGGTNLEEWEKTQRLLETNVQEALALEVGLLKLRL
ncbi:MAG: hypothetical protein FJ405_15825 [Verrucomicrobia bacterium]|nr:hypothetical protein [Verrucomicrobiota bacterium]